ncbi:TetR/AcrR family transcriptional regulator [Kibdelosporangium aridum]|uniref:Transcriptional regulator, TetR family n=1 Tax=Kibdelosporangium aridum TaxID=2030 RepID=A0A1Y5XXT7_KIBAR|nr:TetR/AcrR family transcriptional regulator [Kibdelosporangium aridum]SMD18952.1 transcriptional regulator, TetR family [Kibdelosporangium aridum]
MTDRRVHKTRDALRRALVELIVERGYDRVTVQDILDRADVGRSTFYTHFHGKDDLLLTGFENVKAEMAGTQQPGDVLSPLRAVFRHAGDNRELFTATVMRHEPAMLVVRREMTKLLTEYLRPHLPEDELDLVVTFVIRGMTGVIGWWLGTKAPLTADEAYERFRRLAMGGIGPLLP